MCGIAGLIGVPGDTQRLGESLRVALRHRGPDDDGLESPIPTVVLVHTRLAILDPTPCGHQPMSDSPCPSDKQNWIVFNGEIYNYLELQTELAASSWPCRTKSDTEVILNSYRVWGSACVEHLRGMFAFCLVDEENGVAHLYRDRLGIKPLYLYRPSGGGLIFSSEIRALLSLGPNLVPPIINRSALESFFAQGAVQGSETLVQGISMLEPGTHLTIDLRTGKELQRETYWRLPRKTRDGLSREAAVEELSSLAREAVRLHLISDVPIGLFLSGGVDSAAMLALASEVNVEPIRTISVGFDVDQFDETAAAAATARAFGAQHSTLKITGADVLNALPDILQAMDHPTVDGTNTYVISQAARKAGLTVALSGLGSDEIFGGYSSFTDSPRAVTWRRRLGWIPLPALARKFNRSRSSAKMFEALSRKPELLMMYLLRRELFLPYERRVLQPLPEGCDETTGLSKSLLKALRQQTAELDDINRISSFEIELYMRQMLLRDTDVFSMAAPIECRVPFLDHKLVEFVFNLPGKWKCPDPRPKPLLLDSVGARLPQAAWQHPKRGFTFPWAVWFAPGGALSKIAEETAHDTDIWLQLGIDPAGIRGIWRRFMNGDGSVSPLQLLAFVTLRDFARRHQLRAA